MIMEKCTFSELEVKNEMLYKKNSILREMNGILESEHKELQMLYNVSMNNCITMENDIIDLNNDIAVLKSKLRMRDAEISDYGEDWFELLDENSRLKLRNEWLENAYYNLSCKYDSTDDEIEITVDNIDDI